MKFIPIANPQISKEEATAAYNTISKGWISMGNEVKKLEKEIENYLDVKNAILFNNGTSSLHACLIVSDIKHGDEVIVPTLSYISSANVVLYNGATPIFCECDPLTFNTNIDEIKKKITKKTKAIITVDMKGMPINYDEIKSNINTNKIQLISDSAESFGAEYKNHKVGNQFPLHSFSFFANKNITMGEGGLVTTNDNKLAKKLKIVRNQGQNKRYNHIMLGNNYRPTDYAASIGLVQLKKANKVLCEKNKIAKKYNNSFKKITNLKIPHVPKYVTKHSWYNYCISLNTFKQKKKLLKYLKKNKIDTRESFPPIHLQPYYKKKFNYQKKDYPISENTFNKFIDIPCWMGMKNSQINYVIKKIENFFKNE